MTAQHFEFAARLSRIESGVGSSKSTLYVGPEESYVVSYPRRGRGQGGGLRDAVANATYPLTIIFAFLVGVLANIGTRMISFLSNAAAPTADNIDYLLVMDFVIAMMLSSIIGVIFRIGIKDYIGIRIAGVIAAMIGLHNLVHLYPQKFEMVFSPVWVGIVINNTEPNSLLVRGVSIAF